MALFKIGSIGRTYRHIQRYRHILAIFFKYGFGDAIDKLKIEQYLEIGWQMVSRKRRDRIESLSRADRVRMAIEDLGPTYIKMGQMLSTRPDLLPVEFIQELPKLQDEVPPFSLSEIKDIIAKELHKPIEQVFSSFEEKPLAAASIGQVHKARTFDGQDVVVKVQRPGIQSTIQVDLEIMLHLAGLMEKHLEGWEIHHPVKIVEEFAQTLGKELDYTLEAAYMERFARQFEKEPTVYVPEIFHEASTSRMLTMECITGVKISDIEQLKQENLDRSKIAHQGFDLIMKQIFEHGFFHADPHPGNIFVLPDNILCYIDFGMMGRIALKNREDFADLIMSVAQRNEAKATDVLLRLLVPEGESDYHSLAGDVADFMDRHCYRPLKEIELGKLLNQLLEMTSKHRLSIPPDLFLMIKALTTVEGIGRELDSDFDVIEQAEPFVRQIQLNRLNPRRVAKDMADSGTDLFHFLKELPREAREILKMVKKGKMKIEFKHKGLESMYSTYDRISNRISFAIVLASLIIGSALIVLSDIPPKWYGIPVIGLSGFLLAGMMGFWLLVSIMRRGKL